MGFEWYEVTPEQISMHAGKVRGIAGETGQAGTAVGGVRVPADGYGEAGTQFASMLAEMTAEGVHTLTAAVTALEDAATKLQKDADEYQQAEDAARGNLRKPVER